MSLGISHRNQQQQSNSSHQLMMNEEDLDGISREVAFQMHMPVLVQSIQTTNLAKDIGGITQKLQDVTEENKKLREKLKAFKKENTALREKIVAMENKNRKQEDTIRSLEVNQGKLQKELEIVNKSKDQLRIDIGEKTSKFNTKNKILTEEFEALKKEFEAVEKENKELKRSLEELTDSNSSLKATVDSIEKENHKLIVDMENLQGEHKKILEKLEYKEARLALGQVAWIMEAEIWKFVLPQKTMGKTSILYSMERWLKRNSSNDEGKAAQERWDHLKTQLKWNEDDHKSALKILKDLRAQDAHPQNVDLEDARKQITEGDYIAETEKESCIDIIDMIVKARTLQM